MDGVSITEHGTSTLPFTRSSKHNKKYCILLTTDSCAYLYMISIHDSYIYTEPIVYTRGDRYIQSDDI